jgi:flagellar biosynthetic protein FliQ
MSTDAAVGLFRDAIMVAAKVAGPMLLAALIMGLIVGVLQAATQVNEASISFVTKLIAIGAAIAVVGPWSMRQLVTYTSQTMSSIADVVK